MRKRNVLILFVFSLIVFGCSKKLDGTSKEALEKSLEEITDGMSKAEADSLTKSMLMVMLNDMDMENPDKARMKVHEKTADEIFILAEKIRSDVRKEQAKEQARIDSVRAVYVADSIAKYETQGTWDIKYFVDEFQNETDEGYLVNIAKGVFSNSATTNASLSARVLVTNDEKPYIMLFEYGSHHVKDLSRKYPQYMIKVLHKENKFSTSGILMEDRIYIDEPKLIEVFKIGGSVKMRLVQSTRYSKDEYLIEFDATNYGKAISILNKK